MLFHPHFTDGETEARNSCPFHRLPQLSRQVNSDSGPGDLASAQRSWSPEAGSEELGALQSPCRQNTSLGPILSGKHPGKKYGLRFWGEFIPFDAILGL